MPNKVRISSKLKKKNDRWRFPCGMTARRGSGQLDSCPAKPADPGVVPGVEVVWAGCVDPATPITAPLATIMEQMKIGASLFHQFSGRQPRIPKHLASNTGTEKATKNIQTSRTETAKSKLPQWRFYPTNDSEAKGHSSNYLSDGHKQFSHAKTVETKSILIDDSSERYNPACNQHTSTTYATWHLCISASQTRLCLHCCCNDGGKLQDQSSLFGGN